jgi:hypothetical protein
MIAGGALVALGSVALAFLGPAKLMTTYLIASAVGASTSLGTYYYRASETDCDEGYSNLSEAVCEAAVANLNPAEKAAWASLKAISDAAVADGKNTIVLDGKTYTMEQGWKNFAAKLESGSPDAKIVAKCIRAELESEGA